MKNSTDITIILDRSGSMEPIRGDTIGGINRFIEDQKKVSGECCLSLIQFDDRYEPNYTGRPIAEAQPLDESTYAPRGSTALLDAIGRTINEAGKRFSSMAESDRPKNVVVVIMTDGLENASREFKQSQIADMIKRQTDVYKWNFIFLGANQDAIATAASMNISGATAMTYAHNPIGTRSVVASMSANVAMYRCSAGDADSLKFTNQQRTDAIKP